MDFAVIDAPNKSTTTSASGFVVRIATKEDAPEVCNLFKKIFQQEMTAEHWRWKYDRSYSREIVVYRNEELVAHYGGVGSQVLLAGVESTAIQITDLMVDPAVRNTVRSASPFYLSAKYFLESFVGYNNPFLLAYGFPSERAMGLSEKLALFAPVGKMWEASWQVKATNNYLKGRIIELNKRNFSSVEKKINSLWEKTAQTLNKHYVCKKDADYFSWRYLNHPTKHYSLYLIESRITRKPKALIVLKQEDGKCMLMDILANPLDTELVIGRAINICAEQQCPELSTWHSDIFAELFSVHNFQQKELPIIIPANICSKGPEPASQINKWWFMPGDTDYL